MSRSRFQTSAGPVGRLRIAVIVSLVISAGALLAAAVSVKGIFSSASSTAALGFVFVPFIMAAAMAKLDHAGVPTRALPAEEIILDGRRFDPAEHFSHWRIRDIEERERRRELVPAALAAALAEVPEGRGRWAKVAALLNERTVPTLGGGTAWTADNVRKAARP